MEYYKEMRTSHRTKHKTFWHSADQRWPRGSGRYFRSARVARSWRTGKAVSWALWYDFSITFRDIPRYCEVACSRRTRSSLILANRRVSRSESSFLHLISWFSSSENRETCRRSNFVNSSLFQFFGFQNRFAESVIAQIFCFSTRQLNWSVPVMKPIVCVIIMTYRKVMMAIPSRYWIMLSCGRLPIISMITEIQINGMLRSRNDYDIRFLDNIHINIYVGLDY